MGSARVLVGESVEDPESRGTESQREPERRAVLGVDDVEGGAQEVLKLPAGRSSSRGSRADKSGLMSGICGRKLFVAQRFCAPGEATYRIGV
jgi:hypothetical protein